MAADGPIYRAKRAGWKESLTAEQLEDLDPYDYTSDDLEGPMEIVDGEGPWGKFRTVLVGGQEADPETVRLVDAADSLTGSD